MKKLILLLSVLSIFLIPSMSFADTSLPYNFTRMGSSGSLFSYYSSSPFVFSSGGLISDSVVYYYKDGVMQGQYSIGTYSYSTTEETLLSQLSNATVVVNHTIYRPDGSLFFLTQEPEIPLIQVVEELPPVVAQAGGTVLSVALTGFGILLVVSLIPRLVKLFLY